MRRSLGEVFLQRHRRPREGYPYLMVNGVDEKGAIDRHPTALQDAETWRVRS